LLRNCKAGAKVIPNEDEHNNQYHISIPEWITILNNESSNAINYYLSVTAILIVIFITVIELSNGIEKLDRIGILFAYLLFIFIFGFVIYFLFKYYIKPYRDLLTKIIYGKITSSEEILKKYKKIKKMRQDWETD
jgi:hypothetical protein